MLSPDFELIDEAPFGGGGLRARKLRLRANGLRLIVLRDPAAPVVAYRSWLGVGSSVERPGKTGLAHLFEHLLFKGTAKHPDGELDALFEAVGASTNAQTWFDFTAYQEELPAESLALAAELEADRFVNLVLDDAAVQAELEVVKNERRMAVDNEVDGFLEEQLFRLAFPDHPYGTPTIGWMNDLEGLGPDDARAFYRTHYTPDRLALVVVGDVDEAALCRLVSEQYGPLRAAPPDPATRPAHAAPLSGTARADFVRPCLADRLRIGWRAPALADDDYPRLELLGDILLGGPSSRLYRTLIVEQQVASEAWVSQTPTREPGLFDLGVCLQRGHSADEALALVDAELDRCARDGLRPEELTKAQNRMEARLHYSLREVGARADAFGLYETVTGDYRNLLAVGGAYLRTTLDDLRRLASALAGGGRAVVVAHPGDGADGEGGADPADDGEEDE